jgi:hypothetical protein
MKGMKAKAKDKVFFLRFNPKDFIPFIPFIPVNSVFVFLLKEKRSAGIEPTDLFIQCEIIRVSFCA